MVLAMAFACILEMGLDVGCGRALVNVPMLVPGRGQKVFGTVLATAPSNALATGWL